MRYVTTEMFQVMVYTEINGRSLSVNNEKTNTLMIRTPEGIIFPLQPAGPVIRCLAWSLDMMVIAAASQFLQMFLGVLKFVSYDLASAFTILTMFAVSVGYSITAEWYWRGQTLGKRLLRLRVMDEQGLRLRFSQVFIRNLLRFADSLPIFYLLGGIACLVTSRARRLGDMAANTIVIRIPETAEPDMDQLLGNRYNSFRDYPHICARLRQNVSNSEAGMVLQILLRRDELEPSARMELCRELSAHFRQKTEYPPEVTEGISDEQYLRNVADVLYRN